MKIRNILFGTLASLLFLSSCASENTETTADSSDQKTEIAEQKQVEVIELNQIPGEFTNGNITLNEGTYSFAVKNDGVDHEVGLVVAPQKDEITPEDHLQNGYVTETVKNGETQSSKGEVTLEKGTYVYFCPLNPTPQYTITVE